MAMGNKNAGKMWEEKFKDGRTSIFHNHPFRKLKGKRPRPPGPLKRLMARATWTAKAPEYGSKLAPLSLPVSHVRYTQTNSSYCRTYNDCVDLLQELQWTDMKNGLPDIQHNFLVASDGSVYEGRGWQHDAERPAELAHLAGKCVDVAFIGDYTAKKLPKKMMEAADDLIDWGVYHYKVECCHQGIPLQQQLEAKPAEETSLPDRNTS